MYEHGFDKQHDAGINIGQIIFFKFVPIVANDTVDSTNGVIDCRKKKFMVWYYWLIMIVQLIEQGQVVIPTVSMI